MRIATLVARERWRPFAGTVRILEEIVRAGHEALDLSEERLSFVHQGEGVTVLHEGSPLGSVDCIIARPNFIEEPTLHVFAYAFLQHAGYSVMNGGEATLWVKNKLMQRTWLLQRGIPTPRFATAAHPAAAISAADVLGYPVVLKVSFGAVGKGVFFAPDRQTLAPLADYLALRDGNPLIVEEYVPEARHGDVRLFVVDGQIVASMLRTPGRSDEFRSNAHAGGHAVPVQPTPQEERLALAATAALGLDIAGVDLLRTARGPLIMEVNANPGFATLEKVSGVNVAAAIVAAAVQRARCGQTNA